ncbi:thioredoxin-like domain-containing protein [Rhodonellum sp.]|uniref:TlpA family protein disulfide reductase n=1 Tax=Rhodonellum sp. TaxID=2231180 RepID=UPI00271F8FCA|nr:thioredoxin-like domain-containing protein [Rhodonellum sp.]MDO9553266.1 thioredoxin-like domain-containing protein [Rhodonellum sp.]
MKTYTFFFILASLFVFTGQSIAQQKVAVHPGAESADSVPTGVGASAPVVLYGEISDFPAIENINIRIFRYPIGDGRKDPTGNSFDITTRKGEILNGITPMYDRMFDLLVPDMDSPAFMTISNENTVFMENYLIEPGDSIKIRFDLRKNRVVFGGPAAPKFRCQQELEVLYYAQQLEKPVTPLFFTSQEIWNDPDGTVALQNTSFGRKVIPLTKPETALESTLKQIQNWDDKPYQDIINRYRDQMGPVATELLSTEYFAKTRYLTVYEFCRYFLPLAIKKGDLKLLDQHRQLFENEMKNLFPKDNNLTAHSQQFIMLKEMLLMAEANLSYAKITEIWERMDADFFRDILITKHLMEKFSTDPSDKLLLENSLDLLGDRGFHRLITEMYDKTSLGTTIPNFVMTDEKGLDFELEQLRGKVVLIDFWFTGCGACVQINKNFLSKADSLFQGQPGFKMVSVSADKDRETWMKSVVSGRYSPKNAIHLIAEGGGENDFLKDFGINIFPYMMLLDQQGKIIRSGIFNSTPKEFIQLISDSIRDLKAIQ